MTNQLSSLFFCFVLFLCSFQLYLAEEQRIGWTTDFEYNAKSLPSIEVKLSPPENPLPQVSAEIKKLETSRLKLEESLMEKLEDEFNRVLTTSKLRIKETIEKTLSVFDNPNMLRSIISNSVKPLKRDHIRKVKDNQEELSEDLETNFNEGSGPLPPPEVRNHISFIEQNYLKGTTPSVKITLSEITEPDVAIKDKIEEIEQYRSDEEVMMFESAISEMNSLREITILELEKQIQLQLNPFLVDKMIVHRTLEQELKELTKKEETKNMRDNDSSEQSSFLETDSLNEDNGNILNVKISQTDSNYPTVDELVMKMQQRRDLTERLERQKILDLQMKLLKVQSEMIKDNLHFSISKIIAQYSPIVETMKMEAMRII